MKIYNLLRKKRNELRDSLDGMSFMDGARLIKRINRFDLILQKYEQS